MYAIYQTDAGFKDNDSLILYLGEERSIIAKLEKDNWNYKISYITECNNTQLIPNEKVSITITNNQKELKEFLEDFKSNIPYNTDGDKVFKPTLKEFKTLLGK